MILAIQCLNRDSEIQELFIDINRKELSLNNSQDLKLIQEKINEEIEKRINYNVQLINKRYKSNEKRR